MYCPAAASAGDVFGPHFVLLAHDALPAARAVLDLRVVGVFPRAENVARRLGRWLAVEALHVHRRHFLACDEVGTVVVGRRHVVVAVGPRPIDERRADEDDAAPVEAIGIRRGYRGDGYGT